MNYLSPAPIAAVSERKPYVIGALHLDPNAMRACRDGIDIKLSAAEFKFLDLLGRLTGRTRTHLIIAESIFGTCNDKSRASAHMRKRILAKAGRETGFAIRAVYGVGYRLDVFASVPGA